jgi:hypothetical protein
LEKPVILANKDTQSQLHPHLHELDLIGRQSREIFTGLLVIVNNFLVGIKSPMLTGRKNFNWALKITTT